MAVAGEERYTDTLPTEPSSEYKVFSNIPMVSKKTKKKGEFETNSVSIPRILDAR